MFTIDGRQRTPTHSKGSPELHKKITKIKIHLHFVFHNRLKCSEKSQSISEFVKDRSNIDQDPRIYLHSILFLTSINTEKVLVFDKTKRFIHVCLLYNWLYGAIVLPPLSCQISLSTCQNIMSTCWEKNSQLAVWYFVLLFWLVNSLILRSACQFNIWKVEIIIL